MHKVRLGYVCARTREVVRNALDVVAHDNERLRLRGSQVAGEAITL